MSHNQIPDSHRDLLTEANYAVLTTIAPDGEPENTVVWCSYDGTHVLVNTAEGRRKPNNIKANPKVALCVLDPKNPYRWIDVRGVVEEIVPDKNYAHANALAKTYAGVDEYYGGVAPADAKGTEERVVLEIKPEHVVTFGS